MSHPLSFALVLSAAIGSSAAAEGNVDHGKTLFSRCAGCHAVTAQNKVGPGLAGVFGRQAGAVLDVAERQAGRRPGQACEGADQA